MKRLRTTLTALAVLGVAACSGGSKSSPPPPPPGTNGTWTLSGVVSYDKVPTTGAYGLDFPNTAQWAIRGAKVEVLGATGSVVAAGESDDLGQYTLTWTGLSVVRVRVRAETVTPPIQVEDNTSGNAIYAMVSGTVDASTTSSVSLNAGSGWTGSGYGAARVAAPFAILDTAYTAATAFLAERSVSFPALKINWSVNNRPESGDKALGQITTSHWDGSELYILGKAGVDTDEFDSMVIAHEWGHYFESKLSRSDSPGGTHGFGDYKDPRLSWGEGWATGLAAIVLFPDIQYVDTYWNGGVPDIAISYDVEDNTAQDQYPGWYSETSIIHVFYDLWDPYRAAEPFDTVALPLGAIYDVMVGAQTTTPAFTTLFSFIAALKAQNPGSASAIDTLLAYRGVASPVADAYGSTETHDGGWSGYLPVYAVLPVNGAAQTLWLWPDATTYSNSLDANRLAVFQATGTTATISVSSGSDLRVRVYRSGTYLGYFDHTGGAGTDAAQVTTTAGAVYTIVVTGFDATNPPAAYSATLGVSTP